MAARITTLVAPHCVVTAGDPWMPCGFVDLTEAQVELTAGGIKVVGAIEKNIALSFMMYGRWIEDGPRPIMRGDNLEAIEYSYHPEDSTPSQGFAIVAAASSLASEMFNAMTTRDGRVVKIQAGRVLEPPFPRGGSDYASESLPIWRFELSPTPIEEQR